jgi:plastocyanin
MMRSRAFVTPRPVPASRSFIAPRAAFPRRVAHFPIRSFPQHRFPRTFFPSPFLATGYGAYPMVYTTGYGAYQMPYSSAYRASPMAYMSGYGSSQMPYGSSNGSNQYSPYSGMLTDSNNVTLYDNSFRPNQITAAAGTTVRWVNDGQHHHTVTSDSGLWDSGELASGESYEYTFAAAGTYRYHCKFHDKEMRGVVIVR